MHDPSCGVRFSISRWNFPGQLGRRIRLLCGFSLLLTKHDVQSVSALEALWDFHRADRLQFWVGQFVALLGYLFNRQLWGNRHYLR